MTGTKGLISCPIGTHEYNTTNYCIYLSLATTLCCMYGSLAREPASLEHIELLRERGYLYARGWAGQPGGRGSGGGR